MSKEDNIELKGKQYPKILLRNGELLEQEIIREIDNKRAMPFEEILEHDIDLKVYSYKNLPIGVMSIKLDFKVWGNYRNLELFFTNIADEKKYKISVFQQPISDAAEEAGYFGYRDDNKNYEFSVPNNIGCIFDIEIRQLKKSKSFGIVSAKKL